MQATNTQGQQILLALFVSSTAQSIIQPNRPKNILERALIVPHLVPRHDANHVEERTITKLRRINIRDLGLARYGRLSRKRRYHRRAAVYCPSLVAAAGA
jgi:hypothetical protein